jgi:TonB-dependent SusC/RagA subfamily outer membrane receptor
MNKLHALFLLAGNLLFTAPLSAQSSSAQPHPAHPASYAYDKEKIYVQTDHVFFSPGETLFYKVYLVNGADNKPSSISNVVYIEIKGPSGTVLTKQTYQVEDGYAEGSYSLDKQSPGGVYQLKAYTSWMLNEKDSTFFKKSFTVQRIVAPRVLMKLDFEKKGYGAGDAVKANFSMRSLDDMPIRNYSGDFTVTLGGNDQTTGSFRTDANGNADLTFSLPKSLNTTDGLLNVTVRYDAYTESIARSIPITLNRIDLQFLPEGGSFVAGLTTNMAFKAINEFGKPVDVKGFIRDSRDHVVAEFDSYKFGMGIFSFTPAPGETYTASITTPANITDRYKLPPAASEGVVMNIRKKGGIVTVTCTAGSEAPVRLVGRTKDVGYFSRDLRLKKGINDITLEESLFPAGIAQFTLYSSSKRPLAERLVFLNSERRLHVTISTDKQRYMPREKVRMTITTSDDQDRPIPSNLSLSVIDDKLWTLADDRQDNILSWLLMSSELRGPIEEPSFYFKKAESKAPLALDLVMMTNGYRYFDFIDDVIRNGELKFTPDESNIVSGVITNEKGLPVQATVFLVNNTAQGRALRWQTGPDGQFYFPNLAEGGNYLLITGAKHSGGSLNIQLQQNGLGHNPLSGLPLKQLRIDDKFEVMGKPLDQSVTPRVPAHPSPRPVPVDLAIRLGNKSSALSEVVVVGYGVMRKRDLTGSVAIVYGDELKAVPPDGIAQVLQGKVPGIQVTPKANPGDMPAIRVRGVKTVTRENEPLIVVDGVPQEKYDLSRLNVEDIQNITVLKDATAIALYGARAANGVILIQSKTLHNSRLRFNIAAGSQYASRSFVLGGPAFTVARRFYAPQYKSIVPDERNDYRETIYWNPVVQTDRNGKASVEFYNSDATTTFRAIAEGIGYNGRLGRADTTWAAVAGMSIDAKIPPYLTVGDHALIPVVIKNNSSEKLAGTIEISLPDSMYSGTFDRDLALDPGSSKQVLIPLAAAAPLNGKIGIRVNSNVGRETVVLPIDAAAKGFPVIETFSGNTTAERDMHIGDVFQGSLHAKLTLYRDLEGQLLSGIESMLSEPYGCFEQTSSTTYPNIFILKYLRQSGKSNPSIEQKAMSYLEHGYKRLVGFETPENGFEWFGQSPAHAALTAYGLLEFTDMQEFIDVDRKMISRTKDFLLHRRDGLGGFKISSGGYDHFAAVPDRIANIYIVYALTQAGYGNEIPAEYAAALKRVVESNDAYLLAMMALAASNMNRQDDYNRLIHQLNENYRRVNLAAETSVVNSRDVSLRVETMALYALALMRNSRPDLGTIAELISKVLSKRSYYGYGSTQGTVLALKAITEFTRLAGEQAKSTDMRFSVDGRTVATDDDITNALHSGSNALSIGFPGQERGIPYDLRVSYNTPTPPNSEKADLLLHTALADSQPRVGATVRLTITVTNRRDTLQPMAIAKIGIPAGLSLQPWQLKELADQHQFAYDEIFDNYLVLYWMGFAPKETKEIRLDLKAEIPGNYQAKASNVYLYYTPEYKHWNAGLDVQVKN